MENAVNGKIIFYLKMRLKKTVLLQVKDLHKLLSNSRLKIFFAPFLSSTKHPFEGQEILCVKYGLAPL